MEEETTSRLEETLRELSDDNSATEYIKQHKGIQWKSFSDYFQHYIGERRILTPEIVDNAGFGEYAYQIIRGEKRPTNRDYIISLCIAAGMSVKEIDRALRIAGHNPLNPKDERDVRIVVCVNKEIKKIIDVNLELDKYHLPPL